MRRLLITIAALVAGGGAIAGALALVQDPLDPVHNVALPCEAVSTPGLPPRAAKNLVHLANVCGFVGTDMEFQSRTAADGTVHDYAFVGTMGGGTRIFDVTDPAHPTIAGGYLDPGYQNDVAVRGDLLVLGFDWLGASATTSTCLRQKGGADGQDEAGVDIVRLNFDPETATFETSLIDCYLSSIPTAGAHTTTIHPSGDWLSVSTAFNGLEVVDIRTDTPRLVRWVPPAVVDDAHDVSFSHDGSTLYSAGISSTRIVDVRDVFERAPTLVATIPNAEPGSAESIDISHQSDTSSDGQVFVVTDEAGGGLLETGCNAAPDGKVGGAHFYSLENPAAPRKLGVWLYPNPLLAPDPLAPALAAIGRTERGCTIHVFRNGGNGSSGPGEAAPGFDGVSSLPSRQLVSAHYGAGVWHLDFSGPSSSLDGIAEDPRSTWGNTLGWNVMPGADTWSAKEYKGHIYAGDMARGFDVYAFGRCAGAGCTIVPMNVPGGASGGGATTGTLAELSILSGTGAGGKATFGFDASYTAGALGPSGSLTFTDHRSGKKVRDLVVDSFAAAGTKASFRGRGTVDGVPGVAVFVEVEDLGEPGRADTFRIVLGDGYGAGGVLLNGNIEVKS